MVGANDRVLSTLGHFAAADELRAEDILGKEIRAASQKSEKASIPPWKPSRVSNKGTRKDRLERGERAENTLGASEAHCGFPLPAHWMRVAVERAYEVAALGSERAPPSMIQVRLADPHKHNEQSMIG